MNEPLDVNLADETLRLWSCGHCKALTLREDKQAHIDWHTAMGA
jgi:hypothetical protein